MLAFSLYQGCLLSQLVKPNKDTGPRITYSSLVAQLKSKEIILDLGDPDFFFSQMVEKATDGEMLLLKEALMDNPPVYLGYSQTTPVDIPKGVTVVTVDLDITQLPLTAYNKCKRVTHML